MLPIELAIPALLEAKIKVFLSFDLFCEIFTVIIFLRPDDSTSLGNKILFTNELSLELISIELSQILSLPVFVIEISKLKFPGSTLPEIKKGIKSDWFGTILLNNGISF